MYTITTATAANKKDSPLRRQKLPTTAGKGNGGSVFLGGPVQEENMAPLAGNPGGGKKNDETTSTQQPHRSHPLGRA